MNDEQNKERKGQLEGWFLLELFGHTKIAGKVSEVTLGTTVMLRVDVPEVKYQSRDYMSNKVVEQTIAPFTKFYSTASLFAATPINEETAKAMMQNLRVVPVQEFEVRPALPAPQEQDEEEAIIGELP